MVDRLGVGFVGAGFITGFHTLGWQGVRGADIRGVLDKDQERAEKAADRCRELKVGNPKVFSSLADMVRDPEIDALWIGTPNYTRIPMMEEIVAEIKAGRGKLIGIACEKPLARTVKEARRMVELAKEAGILDGYLENQVFAPSMVRGKEILWGRGAAVAGRPYLARCAEEHGGPHEPWFWSGKDQGGGVLNDMMCHSIEAARYLLSDPKKPKSSLTPKAVTAEIASLKWSRPEYASKLSAMTGGYVDYTKAPAEDFARANVVFEDESGNLLIAEVTTSWSFVGPGLRLSFELMGPEYYLQINTLDPDLQIFFSREIAGAAGEDMVEKQAAEQGLMPVLSAEEVVYGYTGEDRHMVECFLEGKRPDENWDDGLLITELLMTAYMSAEKGEKLAFPPKKLDSFVPKVAQGTWQAKDLLV
ncbi:Gfo/Idh/MocA family protein [candidate division KSB1 bacterium]